VTLTALLPLSPAGGRATVPASIGLSKLEHDVLEPACPYGSNRRS
jgi:hypothetical protein